MNIKEINKATREAKSLICNLTAYIVRNEEAITTTNKNYLKVTLQDKTGEILFNKWDSTELDKDVFKPGSIVDFKNVQAKEYNGNVGLQSNRTSEFSESADDPCDYILTIIPPIEDLVLRFKEHAKSITNPELEIVLKEIVNPKFKEFKDWPAAEKMHHATRHGLLYHTVGILDKITALHPFTGGDLQLMKAAAMIHDIEKVVEYDVDAEFNGQLSPDALEGHLVLASQEIAKLEYEGKISKELKRILSHCILAHHGKLDFGSPVIPAIKEAFILSVCDNLDAKLYVYDFENLVIDEGSINQKGTFALDKARLYKTTWHS